MPGLPGVDGSPGYKGQQGEKGDFGDIGQRVCSLSILLVDRFPGTGSSFTVSVQGKRGKDGYPGYAGPKGSQGEPVSYSSSFIDVTHSIVRVTPDSPVFPVQRERLESLDTMEGLVSREKLALLVPSEREREKMDLEEGQERMDPRDLLERRLLYVSLL